MNEFDIPQVIRPDEAIKFSRYPEGDAVLEALKYDNIDDEDLARIVEICNQELVFGEIANHTTGGQPYETEHARQFLEIGDSGWKNSTNFIYIIRDESKKIVAAMNLKSADEVPEIGYWADKESPGFITNAVAALATAAERAGFQGLKGRTRVDNEKSANVFRRLGWDEETVAIDEKQMLRFSTKF